MKKIDTLTQDELLPAVRELVDAARIADPLHGPSAGARKRLRQLIRENPHSIQALHVRHNIGKVRAEWLDKVIAAELNGSGV